MIQRNIAMNLFLTIVWTIPQSYIWAVNVNSVAPLPRFLALFLAVFALIVLSICVYNQGQRRLK